MTLWIVRGEIIRTVLYVAIVTTIAYSVQFLQASYGLLRLRFVYVINQSFINNKRANWPLTVLYKNIKVQ